MQKTPYRRVLTRETAYEGQAVEVYSHPATERLAHQGEKGWITALYCTKAHEFRPIAAVYLNGYGTEVYIPLYHLSPIQDASR